MRKPDWYHIIQISQLPKLNRSYKSKKKKSLPPPRQKNKIFFCFVLFSFVFVIFSFFSVIDECVIYNLCNGAVASYQLEAINIEIKQNPNVKPNYVHVMAVQNKCIYLPFAYLIFIALSQKNIKNYLHSVKCRTTTPNSFLKQQDIPIQRNLGTMLSMSLPCKINFRFVQRPLRAF